MAYTKNPTWQASPSTATPITATALNHIEDGIATVSTDPRFLQIGPGVTVTGTPTAGQVPTATSGTAATWQTPSGGSAVLPGPVLFTNGALWLPMVPVGYKAASVFPGRNANNVGGFMFGLSRGVVIGGASVNVATAGAAGATARFGIYGVDANDMPTTTVLDSGSVAVTATGPASVVQSLTIPAGNYWAMLTCSDTTARFDGWQNASGMWNSAFGSTANGIFFSSVSAPPASALPSLVGATVGTGNFGTDGAPIIQLKVTGLA